MKYECRELTYKLRRVVCNEDDSHIALEVDRATPQDIIRSTHMFYRVCVKGETTQGRVLVSYAAGTSPA